jgi:hypothetical protein
MSTNTWARAVVLYDYQPNANTSTSTENQPIELRVGDLLDVVEQPGDEWWWAQKLDADGHSVNTPIGVVPSNYVRVVDTATTTPDAATTITNTNEENSSSGYSSGSRTSAGSCDEDEDEDEDEGKNDNSSRIKVRPSLHHVPAVATYDYEGDELRHVLTLHKGDRLHVVNDPDRDWWEASMDDSGHVGLVSTFDILIFFILRLLLLTLDSSSPFPVIFLFIRYHTITFKCWNNKNSKKKYKNSKCHHRQKMVYK